jgi:NAD(P)-dependent dehydrogenase (short-subunit alcohol dehydrogenase family)
MSHAERSYLVTAAAGGIGGALVMLLLEAGAGVLACDISGKRLAALEERAGSRRDRLAVLKVDVADEKGAGQATHAAIERFGTLHGLANVAGGIAGIGEGHHRSPDRPHHGRGIPADRAPEPRQRVLHDARPGSALRSRPTARS